MSNQQQQHESEQPASKKRPKVSEMPDADGNKIIATDDGEFIQLQLKLKSEGRKRKLGTIDKARGYFFVERSRDKHLFLKNESYGFNYGVLEKAQTFQFICLSDDQGGRWKIPVEYIMDKKNHKIFYFKGEGFERQVFLPLSLMEPYRKQPNY